MFHVEFIRTETGFTALRQEWNDLLGRSQSESVFLTWEWLYTCWRCLTPELSLNILAVRDRADRLVGLGPFCIAPTAAPIPMRTLAFLGTERVCSEYLDIVAEPGIVPEVVGCIWAALRQEMHAWDCIRFTDLLEDSVVLKHLVPLARPRDFLVLEGKGQICPYFVLGNGRKGFWKALSSNHRSNLRRRTRKLFELGTTFEVIDSMDRLPGALGMLFELHAKRWADRNQRGVLSDEAIRRFHRQVVSFLGPKGQVRIYTLRTNGNTVASLYALEYKNHLFYYQSGFDPAIPDPRLKGNHYAPGFVLMGQVLEDIAERGLVEFDFLRGAETYKIRWTDTYRVTRSVTLVPRHRWNPVVQIGIEWTLAAIKRGIRCVLCREIEPL